MDNEEENEEESGQEITLEQLKEQLDKLNSDLVTTKTENNLLKDQINKLILKGSGDGYSKDKVTFDKLVGDIE